MRQTAGLRVVAALIVFASAGFAADAQLMGMVMPDAKILAGVNAANARISPFGQFIIAKVAMLGVGPRKFVEATGFDPLQDVSEVLAATAADHSQPGAQPAGLLLVRGNFNVDKIVAAISAKAPQTQAQNYAGATLLSFANPKTNRTQALAFIGNSIAVFGDPGIHRSGAGRTGESTQRG